MNHIYTESQASFLILDFQKPHATRACLESIRRHVRFPTKVIYLHNGEADYPATFLKEGLIDQLIMPRANGGLGLGTRDLFAACFSPYAIYWQNDQIMGRDFTQEELNCLIRRLTHHFNDPADDPNRQVRSVSLAGSPCGDNVYSERAHIIATHDYKDMETNVPLSHGGAGPYHDVLWREGQIQQIYRDSGWIHDTHWPPFAIDNGQTAERQNPDGSRWMHYPDTKQLWLLPGPPVKERFVYPKLTDAEWDEVIKTQFWPPGKIPANEVKDSFHVWH